jgi:hypothetical protein
MKKKKLHHFCDGQSLSEYVILIAIVSAALLAMQVYMKRAIQAAIRVASDQAGKQDDVNPDVTDETAIRSSSYAVANENNIDRKRTFTGGIQRTDLPFQVDTGFESWTTISKEDE